ncbi:Tol-Pal system peptidoglycan-associated lipoprotein PAL [hydrothermal vent metagenome]|uniref:Tol-Pal system peptidoglycan-associated lipoprotein PAL n=1 Tax=hydrothermal vent metagenome TaxID=652676 RepID=A0A3B0WBP4_9ZZZZ
MLVRNIKGLFIVGFLGLSLVGCSSTPNPADAPESNEVLVEEMVVEQVSEDVNAAKQARARDLAAQKSGLLATIQREVVYFDFDQSDVKSQFYSVIKANADYMALEPTATVTVSGYCDERGTREYNMALGEHRANAVKRALIAEGVSPSRINVVSYGEENPAAEGHGEAAWSKNRRAEFSY